VPLAPFDANGLEREQGRIDCGPRFARENARLPSRPLVDAKGSRNESHPSGRFATPRGAFRSPVAGRPAARL